MQNRESNAERAVASVNLTIEEILQIAIRDITHESIANMSSQEQLMLAVMIFHAFNTQNHDNNIQAEPRVEILDDEHISSDATANHSQSLQLFTTLRQGRRARITPIHNTSLLTPLSEMTLSSIVRARIDSRLFMMALQLNFASTQAMNAIAREAGNYSQAITTAMNQMVQTYFEISRVNISNNSNHDRNPQPQIVFVDPLLLHDVYGELSIWRGNPTPEETFINAVRTNNQAFVERYVYAYAKEPYFYASLQRAMHAAQQAGHDEIAAQLCQLITDIDATNNAADETQQPIMELLNKNERLLKNNHFEGQVPASLCCPVVSVIFTEPVTICTGYTYELSTLRKLFTNSDQSNCPYTQKSIDVSVLTISQNRCLNDYLDAFIKSAGKLPLDEIARLLTCPLSKKLFTDPVTFSCGLTLERSEIANRFNANPHSEYIDIECAERRYRINSSELTNFTTIAIKELVEQYHKEAALQPPSVNVSQNEISRTARPGLFDRTTSRTQDAKNDDTLSHKYL